MKKIININIFLILILNFNLIFSSLPRKDSNRKNNSLNKILIGVGLPVLMFLIDKYKGYVMDSDLKINTKDLTIDKNLIINFNTLDEISFKKFIYSLFNKYNDNKFNEKILKHDFNFNEENLKKVLNSFKKQSSQILESSSNKNTISNKNIISFYEKEIEEILNKAREFDIYYKNPIESLISWVKSKFETKNKKPEKKIGNNTKQNNIINKQENTQKINSQQNSKKLQNNNKEIKGKENIEEKVKLFNFIINEVEKEEKDTNTNKFIDPIDKFNIKNDFSFKINFNNLKTIILKKSQNGWNQYSLLFQIKNSNKYLDQREEQKYENIYAFNALEEIQKNKNNLTFLQNKCFYYNEESFNKFDENDKKQFIEDLVSYFIFRNYTKNNNNIEINENFIKQVFENEKNNFIDIKQFNELKKIVFVHYGIAFVPSEKDNQNEVIYGLCARPGELYGDFFISNECSKIFQKGQQNSSDDEQDYQTVQQKQYPQTQIQPFYDNDQQPQKNLNNNQQQYQNQQDQLSNYDQRLNEIQQNINYFSQTQNQKQQQNDEFFEKNYGNKKQNVQLEEQQKINQNDYDKFYNNYNYLNVTIINELDKNVKINNPNDKDLFKIFLKKSFELFEKNILEIENNYIYLINKNIDIIDNFQQKLDNFEIFVKKNIDKINSQFIVNRQNKLNINIKNKRNIKNINDLDYNDTVSLDQLEIFRQERDYTELINYQKKFNENFSLNLNIMEINDFKNSYLNLMKKSILKEEIERIGKIFGEYIFNIIEKQKTSQFELNGNEINDFFIQLNGDSDKIKGLFSELNIGQPCELASIAMFFKNINSGKGDILNKLKRSKLFDSFKNTNEQIPPSTLYKQTIKNVIIENNNEAIEKIDDFMQYLSDIFEKKVIKTIIKKNKNITNLEKNLEINLNDLLKNKPSIMLFNTIKNTKNNIEIKNRNGEYFIQNQNDNLIQSGHYIVYNGKEYINRLSKKEAILGKNLYDIKRFEDVSSETYDVICVLPSSDIMINLMLEYGEKELNY